MAGNIKNQAGISESNKYGEDMVREALYSSGYAGRSQPGKNQILKTGQGPTIKNDEGISEKNKFGNQLSTKIDSSKDYSGKGTGSRIVAGKAHQTIENDEGMSGSNVYGSAALDTKCMYDTGDYGKSGKAEVFKVKIPHEAIFGKELIKGDYSKKNEMSKKDDDEVNEDY